MAARRMKSLRQGTAKERDGVVWHREHRSKKGRWPAKRWRDHKRKISLKAEEERKSRKVEAL